MTEQIPLTRLASKLRQIYGKPGPGYRKSYNLALDGVLPTEQVKGRLYVREADLPEIAELFGLGTVPRHAVA
jgi:hypothetical protein